MKLKHIIQITGNWQVLKSEYQIPTLAHIQMGICYLLFGIFLTACGGNSTNTTNSDKQIFIYNQPNAVTSLDPAFARSQTNIWAVDHMYNGLVQLDKNLNVQPSIAKSWDISDDGLIYTFSLRDDVYFHDNQCFTDGKGRNVVAADVVYSFNRILDKTVNSPGAWIFKDRVADSEPFKAINDNTFQVKLKRPFRPMLGIFSMQYCSIIPKEAIAKYGKDFRANPVGTGAFKFTKWLENQALLLAKNNNYFEAGMPKVDAVRINFMTDRNTAYLELMNGNLDFISGLESSYADELLTEKGELKPEHAGKLQYQKSPFLNSEYFGINMDFTGKRADSPLQHKKVRQALNYGFDRAKMLQTLRNGVARPATSGFAPAGLPSFDASKVKGYDYNPSKAAKLLAEAGFPNGKNMPEIELRTNSDYLDICQFIARQWEDLGIKTKIELMQSATLRELMSKGEADFFRASWIADYPDAENFMTLFYGKNPAPPNYTRFKNVAFDKLYEAALNENDDAKRHNLYQQMDRIVVEEAPIVFLYYDETARFFRANVNGITDNAINLLSVKKITK